eukprot:COSAG05_NODE_50_length_24118_cov_89.534036_3_plen_352_part_00
MRVEGRTRSQALALLLLLLLLLPAPSAAQRPPPAPPPIQLQFARLQVKVATPANTLPDAPLFTRGQPAFAAFKGSIQQDIRQALEHRLAGPVDARNITFEAIRPQKYDARGNVTLAEADVKVIWFGASIDTLDVLDAIMVRFMAPETKVPSECGIAMDSAPLLLQDGAICVPGEVFMEDREHCCPKSENIWREPCATPCETGEEEEWLQNEDRETTCPVGRSCFCVPIKRQVPRAAMQPANGSSMPGLLSLVGVCLAVWGLWLAYSRRGMAVATAAGGVPSFGIKEANQNEAGWLLNESSEDDASWSSSGDEEVIPGADYATDEDHVGVTTWEDLDREERKQLQCKFECAP